MLHLKIQSLRYKLLFPLNCLHTHTHALFKGMSVFKNVIMEKELQLPLIENGLQVLFSHRTYCSNKILYGIHK